MNDHTRRSWIVTISQAAVTLGIGGTTTDSDIAGKANFPPGVYLPSTDHLSHALASAERYHPIPPGCPTDYVRPPKGSFEPLFVSESEFAVILRATQLLIGDAPNDVGLSQEIAEWIDLRLSTAQDVRTAEERLDPLHHALAFAYFGPAKAEEDEKQDSAKTCRDGVEWILSEARARHSKEFLTLEAEQQIAMLQSVSDERTDKQVENSGSRFFAFLKAETVRGFYTSQAGLKELDFKGNAFYARSPGCQSAL